MRNKFFHFAVVAIASLAMIGTLTASPSGAMPGLETPKTSLITSTVPPLACPNSQPVEVSHVLFTGTLVFIITLGALGLGAVSYRNRQKKRELTLQEQIQLLEKIWKMAHQR